MKTRKVLFFFLFFLVIPGIPDNRIACQPLDFTAPRNAVVRYGDWESISLDQFYIANCIWGKEGITDYDQCIYVPGGSPSISGGWKWRWPALNTGQVKAYPNISFGKNPWNGQSTSPWLPLRMDNIEGITVSYDISHQVSGKYNLSFDIWVTKTPDVTDPPEANIVREIMIWLDEQGEGLILDEKYVKKVVIDGEKYRFLIAKDTEMPGENQKEYKRDYMAFIKDTPEYSGDTKIEQFLEYLLAEKHILPTDYLRNIDLGNEIWHGKGETVLNAYSITVRTGGKSNTATLENSMPPVVMMLMARNAGLKTDAEMRYDSSHGWEYIGWWTKTDEEIHWELPVPQTGKYIMTAQVSSLPGKAGSTVDVTVDNKTCTFTVPETGGWVNFKDIEIGELTLKTGTCKVMAKAVTVKNGFVCNIQSIIFYSHDIKK
ncbi:MAG: hypothetical protein JXB88_25780 [Spirochaetales bacterium]|nr:hypothetical protein [Spirochaetales bacterium]